MGATYVPSRGLKIEYTLEDDQLLWDWMQQYEGKTGYPISGNKIYQDLAAAVSIYHICIEWSLGLDPYSSSQHPRHTYQSYRDRYLKRLRGYPRPGRLVRPTEASSSTTRPPQANAENRQPSPEPAVANVDSNERSNNAPLDTEEQPQQRAGSASNKQDETTHQRTRDTSIHAPTTTDARPQQRRELTTNKQDPPKRKRSPDIGLISEIIEAPSQKRIRQSEPTTREARPSENNHQSGAMHDTEQSEINETQLEEPENPTGNGPENQEDNLLLELPFFPSSPESEVEEPEQDIDEWIDECIQTGKAQNDKQVIEALRCASMDPSVADKALGYLVKGRGVPDDMPGVWTTEDDRALEGTNARAMERVMKKHGTDFVHARWEYLGLARTAGLIDD